MEIKKNAIRNKSFDFAVRIVNLFKYLQENKKEFVMSKQLLRSGTSIGANVREAERGESKADFIHKMAIAQRECGETEYWLELLYATQFLSKSEFECMQSNIVEIGKMITSSIKTAKKNLNRE